MVPASHFAGNQVDCWRPNIGFANLSADTISCGRSSCTAADIFSCSDPNCVQLTDPAEEFLLVFGDAELWGNFGRCFVLSGFLVTSSVIFSRLFCPQAATCVANRSVVIAVLSVFGFAFYVTAFQADVLSFETVWRHVGLDQGVLCYDFIATTMYFSALEEICAVLRERVNIRRILDEVCSDVWMSLFADNDDENRNANDDENGNVHDEDIRHANDDENRVANEDNWYDNDDAFTFAQIRRWMAFYLLVNWYFDLMKRLHGMR
jgi:hypothetical protein